MKQTYINMDDKQRVCLTRVLSKEERDNFSSFRIYREGGKIVLEPVCQVPEKDHWIYKDPKALASLMKGIKMLKKGVCTIWVHLPNMQKKMMRTN